MRLNGETEIGVAPARMRAALQEPDVLAALLPGEVELQPAGDGDYTFTLKKSVGPIEIRQNGTMQVRTPDDKRVDLTLNANHRLAGRVSLALAIALTPRGNGTEIAYDGTLEATGLAGRLLRDRGDRMNAYMRDLFIRLKTKIRNANPA